MKIYIRVESPVDSVNYTIDVESLDLFKKSSQLLVEYQLVDFCDIQLTEFKPGYHEVELTENLNISYGYRESKFIIGYIDEFGFLISISELPFDPTMSIKQLYNIACQLFSVE